MPRVKPFRNRSKVTYCRTLLDHKVLGSILQSFFNEDMMLHHFLPLQYRHESVVSAVQAQKSSTPDRVPDLYENHRRVCCTGSCRKRGALVWSGPPTSPQSRVDDKKGSWHRFLHMVSWNSNRYHIQTFTFKRYRVCN